VAGLQDHATGYPGESSAPEHFLAKQPGCFLDDGTLDAQSEAALAVSRPQCLRLSGGPWVYAALPPVYGQVFETSFKNLNVLMFSLIAASTLTNVYKGFTGKKSKLPNEHCFLTGLRPRTPKRVGIPASSRNRNLTRDPNHSLDRNLTHDLNRLSSAPPVSLASPFRSLPATRKWVNPG